MSTRKRECDEALPTPGALPRLILEGSFFLLYTEALGRPEMSTLAGDNFSFRMGARQSWSVAGFPSRKLTLRPACAHLAGVFADAKLSFN
jgi:hypothetical protein